MRACIWRTHSAVLAASIPSRYSEVWVTKQMNERTTDNLMAEEAAATLPQLSSLQVIEELDSQLLEHFRDKFLVQPSLNRQLVSFQANKTRPAYRWYKFKEAFSASLVEYLFHHYRIRSGKVLDPFAGVGTTLFAASSMGIDADGIELLPIGQQVIGARLSLEREFTVNDFATLLRWKKERPWEHFKKTSPLAKLRITDGAYPRETLESVERYMAAWQQENAHVQAILRFALLCILESISYTRKDGQYLRWDHRSGRRQGVKPFNKGHILAFNEAICEKLDEILSDLKAGGTSARLFSTESHLGAIELFPGSCLDILPTLSNSSYTAVMTSPPYCNRYDYTRTYALELALLGIGEKEIAELRQQMISCTVENRAKHLLALNEKWALAIEGADREELLQAILRYLEEQRALRNLNNSGIPRMVRGYFYEMACAIAECFRVLKSGAPLFMVNDNVRYAGASISVDMILSHIVEQLGFRVENILVLPNGKGNSSQQMGVHGREPLRKCVYVWRKP